MTEELPTEGERPALILLPCAKDKCQECAVDHPPEYPHNAQSLYYQYKFYNERGRWPTWKDALAHCSDDMREYWELELKARGAWTEPTKDIP